jgi:hypothetical protein
LAEVTGADDAGVLVIGAEVAGADVTGALAAGAEVVGADVSCAAGVLVGCGEPDAVKTCGVLVGDEVGGALPALPLIALFRCNQAIWSSVSDIARAA